MPYSLPLVLIKTVMDMKLAVPGMENKGALHILFHYLFPPAKFIGEFGSVRIFV